tara:strand:- start:1099 stop:1638 length:540 start_codon:yes stop_codon:yes gene_type:complete
MEELSLDIFIVPTIALTLVILMYLHFAKQVRDKKDYRNYIIRVVVIAFSFNFIWELVQGPLYEGFEYDWQHISFCALASIADMLMVLILLFGFSLVFKNVFWTKATGIDKVLPLILIGSAGAIIGEIWHVSRGDWAYAETMPVLPLINVGLLPLLQFAVLPYLIFLIGNKLISEKNLQI